MEIRASLKEISKLKKVKNKFISDLTFTTDENVPTPVIMVSVEGKLVEYLKGFKEIKTFLLFGYNRIKKNCPYRIGKCICEKCSLYIIENNTGDCVHNWNFYKKEIT